MSLLGFYKEKNNSADFLSSIRIFFIHSIDFCAIKLELKPIKKVLRMWNGQHTQISSSVLYFWVVPTKPTMSLSACLLIFTKLTKQLFYDFCVFEWYLLSLLLLFLYVLFLYLTIFAKPTMAFFMLFFIMAFLEIYFYAVYWYALFNISFNFEQKKSLKSYSFNPFWSQLYSFTNSSESNPVNQLINQARILHHEMTHLPFSFKQ